MEKLEKEKPMTIKRSEVERIKAEYIKMHDPFHLPYHDMVDLELILQKIGIEEDIPTEKTKDCPPPVNSTDLEDERMYRQMWDTMGRLGLKKQGYFDLMNIPIAERPPNLCYACKSAGVVKHVVNCPNCPTDWGVNKPYTQCELFSSSPYYQWRRLFPSPEANEIAIQISQLPWRGRVPTEKLPPLCEWPPVQFQEKQEELPIWQKYVWPPSEIPAIKASRSRWMEREKNLSLAGHEDCPLCVLYGYRPDSFTPPNCNACCLKIAYGKDCGEKGSDYYKYLHNKNYTTAHAMRMALENLLPPEECREQQNNKFDGF